MGRRLYLQRCAAVAARVCTACALLSVCCLRASQDRSHLDLHLQIGSRRLRIPRACTLHKGVELVPAGCGGEESGPVVRVIYACVACQKV